jgi:TRAP-type C4-dicarboxylate transport system permease small subunit
VRDAAPAESSRIAHLEDGALAILLGALIALSCAQIALRNLFDTGIDWIGPAVRYLVLWIGLCGALTAARRGQHIAIDAFTRLLGPRARAGLASAVALFTAAVCSVVAHQGVRLVALDREAGSRAFGGVPSWWIEAGIPLCFAGMALCYLGRAVRSARSCRTPRDSAASEARSDAKRRGEP